MMHAHVHKHMLCRYGYRIKAELERHSHPVAVQPMSFTKLVTMHCVMVTMHCAMVIKHALFMQVL